MAQAPFLNSLRASGATLTNFYAEEHPSDANYLALAGGSAFGVPLTDPEEENPLYTINATNIGDLVSESGESWKAYLQSANGSCDDTVHGYYWNDDEPMLYFRDVRDRPRYCASHVVPLEELAGDLSNPATTPNFAWIAPDDCADMEGCGIAAGDAFLKTELTEIMNSPAWRTRRSLAIITFDEDAADYQHPAQRVPTIVLASAGVKAGYSDPTRYTHYSLLRAIEAALGLGTLTANDRYAQPLNNIFHSERTLFPAPSIHRLYQRGSGRRRGRGRRGGTARPGRVPRGGRPGPSAGRLGSELRLEYRQPGEPRDGRGGRPDPGSRHRHWLNDQRVLIAIMTVKGSRAWISN